MRHFTQLIAILGMIFLVASAAPAAEPSATSKIPVLLDTDIGTELDGALGVAAALASPEFEILGITTSGKDAMDRAWMVCHMLTAAGRKEIPVAAGRDPQANFEIDWQIQYRRHPAVVWNRTNKPGKQSAEELLAEKLKASTTPVTIIATGPLTNLARQLESDPSLAKSVRQIVCTGSGVNRDVDAAQRVHASKTSMLIVSGIVDVMPLRRPQLASMFAPHNRLSMQIEALWQMTGKYPGIATILAVAAVSNESRLASVRTTDLSFPLGDKTYRFANVQNVDVADRQELLAWFQARVAAAGPTSLPQPPGNRSKLIAAGGLPTRVHAWEDYDTDIEKRWWMAGGLETGDTPSESNRVCRSILTQDFDDLQGNTKTMYAGVVFNPVPGPPMGPRTRLAFRYKLLGTDTLRIQLYSLSKGYHRYLSLSGLPQGSWEDGAVDMTEMRRPDGSGGPLAADERIDDIQFYVDPRATVLIDQMVLYEAAPDDERRPFPRRIFYTGVFDTGKQGKEWPGTFDIIPHEAPNTWKHAKSVSDPEGAGSWIRLDLRGNRQMGSQTALRFRYRLDGAHEIKVRLGHRDDNRWQEQIIPSAKAGEWREASVSIDTSSWTGDARAVNELQFRIPAGATLSLDDVLLYEVD